MVNGGKSVSDRKDGTTEAEGLWELLVTFVFFSLLSDVKAGLRRSTETLHDAPFFKIE